MDANSGEPWSEMDISDLTYSLDYGDTFAQTASFLCVGMRMRCARRRDSLDWLSTPAGASRSFVSAEEEEDQDHRRAQREIARLRQMLPSDDLQRCNQRRSVSSRSRSSITT
jgi:hypothetical protein